ncbi:MAG: hypothetical protein KAX24_01985 [Anaerolineae bacterium]|nr:hypothetical protein [Anaerolineae bacterium]
MPGNPIRPWIAVNEYMQDEYRETLVDLALRHLPHASQDLRVFAKREILRLSPLVVSGPLIAHRWKWLGGTW